MICSIFLVATTSYAQNLFDSYWAIPTEETNLYAEKDEKSEIVCVLMSDISYEVVYVGGEWTKIKLSDEVYGYVQNSYVNTIESLNEEQSVEYTLAVAIGTIETQNVTLSENIEYQAELQNEISFYIEEIESYYDEVSESAAVTTTAQQYVDDVEICLSEAQDAYDELASSITNLDDSAKDEIVALAAEACEAAQTAASDAEVKANDVTSARQAIVDYACSFVGVLPYVYGGTSLKTGADCSGFTQAIYRAYGYSIARTSYAQAYSGTGVSYSEIQPGDLLIFSGHVGIYIGDGKMVHSPHSGTTVKIQSLSSYGKKIKAVRRIIV